MSKHPSPSAIAAVDATPVARPVSVKRLARLRMNWFVVGSVFGVGVSFFMSFLVATLVVPHYRAMMAGHHAEPAEEASAEQAPAPKPIAKATPMAPVIPVADTRQEKLGDGGAVKELAIKLPPTAVTSDAPTKEAVAITPVMKAEVKKLTNRRYGVIKTSLFQGGASAGIPFATMNEIVKAFSYDVDFQRDIHPGDTIEVLLSDAAQAKPKTAKVEKSAKVAHMSSAPVLRYAALTLHGKKQEIFRVNTGGTYAWYDAAGRSIKKSLLATPINAAHITSGFGMREHPVLGYTKFHRGVDFGASTGTPIMAAGDGTVEFKGWQNGYGNFVILKHNSTYETAYGHISKFGKIAVGSRVRQGQVIAYVGMTGMATGPHLHYEVRVNGTQVNPVAKQFNMATGLTGKQLASFKATKVSITNELASLAKADDRVASR